MELERSISTQQHEQDATHYLEVASVEQLGNETMIVFEELGNQLWNAKWPGQWMINPGDKGSC